MSKKCWSEGRAGAGIPVVAFAGVGLVASLPLRSVPVAVISVLVMLAAATVGSGVEIAGDRVRSWLGWGRFRFGRWKRKPADAAWELRRTRESLMNRRGAAGAVGIDTWDLGWHQSDKWCSLHEFTNPQLAEAVRQALLADHI